MEQFALQLCPQVSEFILLLFKRGQTPESVQCCPHLSRLFKPHGFLSYLISTLGWEDPLEKGMATHSSIRAWRIPMDTEAWWATVHGVTNGRHN